MSAFDEWVHVAPYRHIAAFALVILAIVAMLTNAI